MSSFNFGKEIIGETSPAQINGNTTNSQLCRDKIIGELELHSIFYQYLHEKLILF